MSLRLRLMLAFLVVVGLGAWQLYVRLVEDLRPRYLEAMEEGMVDMAELLAAVVAEDVADDRLEIERLRAVMDRAQSRRFDARIYALHKQRVTTDVLVTDAAGIVRYDSTGADTLGRDFSAWNDVMRTLRGTYGARATRSDPDDPRSLVLHVAAPIRADGQLHGALVVQRSVDSVTFFIDAAQRNLAWAVALATLAVALVGVAASLWLTRPLRRLETYVRRLRDGQRVAPPRLRGEIGHVAAAIEELRDALEGKQYAERYIQHLTHEFKSPLASIRGAAELLEEDLSAERRSQFLTNIQLEVSRLRDIVDRLLQLSELESRKHLEVTGPVSLRDIAETVRDECEALCSDRRLTIVVTGPDLTVRGDRFLLRQALRNIVINAIDFAASGGTIGVTTIDDGDRRLLRVDDDGPGIPAYARDRVTERFYSLPRPDSGRKGTGLGLTFVQEVAHLHEARLVIDDVPSGGARVELRFPAG